MITAAVTRRVELRPQVHNELCVGAGGRSWVIRGDEVSTLENTERGFKVTPLAPSALRFVNRQNLGLTEGAAI